MGETYQPVACGLHSEYELLAMHGSKILLHASDDQGTALHLQCRVKDLTTMHGAEYLVVCDNENNILQFRLDKIQSFEAINS